MKEGGNSQNNFSLLTEKNTNQPQRSTRGINKIDAEEKQTGEGGRKSSEPTADDSRMKATKHGKARKLQSVKDGKGPYE